MTSPTQESSGSEIHAQEARNVTATVQMTEEFILQHRLSAPRLKSGDLSYSESEQGFVAYDPKCVRVVSVDDFVAKHSAYQGSKLVVHDCLPPVNWQNPLFSEDDNRADLTNKAYLPLSRVLRQHGLSFGQDSLYKQYAGEQDSVVVDNTTTMPIPVLEEKCKALMRAFFPDGCAQAFPSLCKTGSDIFIQGIDQRKDSPALGCSLILAQLLGHMQREQVTHGIFITSGRAHYVWIKNPVDDSDNEPKKKKAKTNSSAENSETSASIMLSDAVMITHPSFLRVMASFLREGQASSIEEKLRVGQLLALSSEQGGFTRGKSQDISKSARTPTSLKKCTPSKGSATPTSLSFESAPLISQFTKMPPLKHESVLREKVLLWIGSVIRPRSKSLDWKRQPLSDNKQWRSSKANSKPMKSRDVPGSGELLYRNLVSA
jgi:hypothetical protein